MPRQLDGSRRSLCFIASTIACPLTFSIAGTVHGTAAEPEPAPSVIASGIGASMCAASYSPAIALSRMIAQPAVFTSSTLSPCRA